MNEQLKLRLDNLPSGYKYNLGGNTGRQVFINGVVIGYLDSDGDLRPEFESNRNYLCSAREIEEYIMRIIENKSVPKREESMTSQQLTVFQESNQAEEYIEFTRKAQKFTDEENAFIDDLSTTLQKVEGIKHVLAERNSKHFNEKAEEDKKRANAVFFMVIAYLVIIFPVSYGVIQNVSLNVLPAVGAAFLAIFITALLVVLLVIRKVVMEYHDIKARTFTIADKRLFGEICVRDFIVLLVILGVFVSVI